MNSAIISSLVRFKGVRLFCGLVFPLYAFRSVRVGTNMMWKCFCNEYILDVETREICEEDD